MAHGRSGAAHRVRPGKCLGGGGFGWLDVNGVVDPSQPRALYNDARMTHVFALPHLFGMPDTRSRHICSA